MSKTQIVSNQSEKCNKLPENTQHGFDTAFGYCTPHKYPSDKEEISNLLINLTKNLYPTGRVWQMPELGNFELFHIALNTSLIRLIEDADCFIKSTIPELNEEITAKTIQEVNAPTCTFSVKDAELWEWRLGLISNSNVSLETRKKAILRKLAFPSNIKARQHHLYIENQLQLAGFDVYVHENTIPYKTPADILSLSLDNVQHGEPTQHSDSTQHGSGSFKIIANSLNPNEVYGIGGDNNLYATFFISGQDITTQATISTDREKEFRELVLKLKPASTVAFLLINFI